jgi:hypothetical protein
MTAKQFEPIIRECSNTELLRLRYDFTHNYHIPMHPEDGKILQSIFDEVEIRELEETLTTN